MSATEIGNWRMSNSIVGLKALIDIREYADMEGSLCKTQQLLIRLFSEDSSCILIPDDNYDLDARWAVEGKISEEDYHYLKLSRVDIDFDASNNTQECKIFVPRLERLMSEEGMEFSAIFNPYKSHEKTTAPPNRSADDLLAEMTNPTRLMKFMCRAHKAIHAEDKDLYSEKSTVKERKRYLLDNYKIDEPEAKHICLIISSKNTTSDEPTELMEITAKAHNYLWHTDEGKKIKSQADRLIEIRKEYSPLSEKKAQSILNVISSEQAKRAGYK